MNGYYNLFQSSNQWWFNLKAGNHETILQSEGYVSKQGAQNGISSCQTNSQIESRYEKRQATNGQYYFVLKAGNGEIIGRSETYVSLSGRDNGIKSCMTNGKTTDIREL